MFHRTPLTRAGALLVHNGRSGNDAGSLLEDAASFGAETGCGNDPNAGYVADASYRPNNPLAAFNGSELAGDWARRMVAAAANDTGTPVGRCLLSRAPAGPSRRLCADGFRH